MRRAACVRCPSPSWSPPTPAPTRPRRWRGRTAHSWCAPVRGASALRAGPPSPERSTRCATDPARVWIANTDADSVVPIDWLTVHLEFAERGVVAAARHRPAERARARRRPAAPVAGAPPAPRAARARARREPRAHGGGLPRRGRIPRPPAARGRGAGPAGRGRRRHRREHRARPGDHLRPPGRTPAGRVRDATCASGCCGRPAPSRPLRCEGAERQVGERLLALGFRHGNRGVDLARRRRRAGHPARPLPLGDVQLVRDPAGAGRRGVAATSPCSSPAVPS